MGEKGGKKKGIREKKINRIDAGQRAARQRGNGGGVGSRRCLAGRWWGPGVPHRGA